MERPSNLHFVVGCSILPQAFPRRSRMLRNAQPGVATGHGMRATLPKGLEQQCARSQAQHHKGVGGGHIGRQRSAGREGRHVGRAVKRRAVRRAAAGASALLGGEEVQHLRHDGAAQALCLHVPCTPSRRRSTVMWPNMWHSSAFQCLHFGNMLLAWAVLLWQPPACSLGSRMRYVRGRPPAPRSLLPAAPPPLRLHYRPTTSNAQATFPDNRAVL